jgi:hypothetical protein
MTNLKDLTVQEQEAFGAEYERWLDEVEAAYAYREEILAWESSLDNPFGVTRWDANDASATNEDDEAGSDLDLVF